MNEPILTPLPLLVAAHPSEPRQTLLSPFPLERVVEYLGCVNYATNDRVIKEIKELLSAHPQREIYLTVTSAGGPSGTALGFYDHVRTVLRPNLVTIGSGDVDSAGVLVYLCGERRYVTRNTTMLLHLAGRYFESRKRYTADELRAIVREDSLKDAQYAAVVAKRSRGRLSPRKVLGLMRRNSVLTSSELVRHGLADGILG